MEKTLSVVPRIVFNDNSYKGILVQREPDSLYPRIIGDTLYVRDVRMSDAGVVFFLSLGITLAILLFGIGFTLFQFRHFIAGDYIPGGF